MMNAEKRQLHESGGCPKHKQPEKENYTPSTYTCNYDK